MARDYVVYFRLNLKQDLRFTIQLCTVQSQFRHDNFF